MVRICFNYKMAVRIEDDGEQISNVQGLKGSTVLSDRTVVFAVYRDEEYGLRTPDEQLIDTGSDVMDDDLTEVLMHGDS